MKNFLPLIALVGIFGTTTLSLSSCKKAETADMQPREELILGKWNVNRMQLKIYQGGTFMTDTIIKQTPQPENFVNFGADGSFEYRFNTHSSDIGTYMIKNGDSVIATAGAKVYRWKILTLTSELFTTGTTSANDPYYPGAIIVYPGAVIENYQTLVRYR